jgi:hypothetical protein
LRGLLNYRGNSQRLKGIYFYKKWKYLFKSVLKIRITLVECWNKKILVPLFDREYQHAILENRPNYTCMCSMWQQISMLYIGDIYVNILFLKWFTSNLHCTNISTITCNALHHEMLFFYWEIHQKLIDMCFW